MPQQTLVGRAFCAAPPGTDTGTAYTWGKDERVSHPIRVDCVTQVTPDPEQCDHHACDSCGLVVDALAALTRFRVELGHLEGALQFCGDYCPDGAVTYWTRYLADHRVESVE